MFKPGSLFILITISFFVFCKFPYQPEPFVMPQTPDEFYQFPSKNDISAFVGSSNVKIAFTIKENGVRKINFIDYSETTPTLKKLKQPAGKESFHSDSPLLSPDGSFVAYFVTPGAVIEGAYIQQLDPNAVPLLVAAKGTEPHWWRDSSGQVYVIYSDNLESNLNSGEGNTYKQKVSLNGNGSLVGQADIIAPYPMNGGLSKNGIYLCTGYQRAAFYNTVTRELIQINGITQVCNPSIDPDSIHQDRMMFLNWTGKQMLNNPFLDSSDYPKNSGDSVEQHHVIFMVDQTNTVTDFIPLGLLGVRQYEEWQDPEWSNKPSFATALACISGSTADGVIIKNIGDHTVAKETLIFTKGKGKLDITSTPSLWIGN